MARTRRYELGVGCLLVVAVLLVAFMALRLGAISGFGNRFEVTASFPDAAGLTQGAAVAVAGVQVGTISKLSLVDGRAVAELSLDPSAAVRKDALVRVRSRSVLGEKYIELAPGTGDAPLAEDGDALAVQGRSYDIDGLVQALGPLVEAVDPAVAGEVLERLGAALREDPDRFARMLESGDRILENTAAASQDLPAAVEEARATLAETRSAAAEARVAMRRATAVMDRADGVVARVDEAAPELIDDVSAAAADIRELLERLDASSGDIERILSNLSEIDKWELRRLLREEGILVRLRKHEVVEDDAPSP